MPLPLETTPSNVIPNTYRYDLSIASRISDGQLKVTIGMSMHPANCDEKGVWSNCYAESVGEMIPDLDEFCVKNPDMAELVGTAYELLNQAVGAINEKLKLV